MGVGGGGTERIEFFFLTCPGDLIYVEDFYMNFGIYHLCVFVCHRGNK